MAARRTGDPSITSKGTERKRAYNPDHGLQAQFGTRAMTASGADMTASRADIREAIGNSLRFFVAKEVQSEEECAERLNALFREAYENAELVSVEKLAVCLGINPGNFPEWERGIACTPAIARQIQRAKAIVQTMEAELVSKGRLPVVSYIFRAKNFYGMRDQIDVAPIATQNGASLDQLKALYLGAGDPYPDAVTTTFEESESEGE